MPMPSSQRGLLDKALAALTQFATAAQGHGITITQVNATMPAPTGKGSDAAHPQITFLWDAEAQEFVVQT